MEQSALPLEKLFYRLRDHGLPLGIAEYRVVLQALQAGFGLSDRSALRQLCLALWVTSDEEELIFHRLFDQMLAEPTAGEAAKKPAPPKAQSSQAKVESPPEEEEFDPGEYEPPTPDSMPASEPSGMVQALRRGGLDLDLARPRYSLLTEYFPVTRRQMKQSWRHLRRPVRQGPPVELDIDATVERIGREGLFWEPVLLPRRSNRAEIVLLIDQDGSMVPFHALSRQLIETINRGGRLQQTHVYYFHDYPEEYLYLDPARLEARKTIDVLMGFDAYTAILVISDGGAARGRLDQERVAQTRLFLETLGRSARRFAWLNPMPNLRWANTTAGSIARLVPMFDLSRRGLDEAINTLRGRYVYGEKLYPWMK